MKQLGLGALLAAIAMFLWGFAFWGAGIADPFEHMSADQEAALASDLGDRLPGNGIYVIPDITLDPQEAQRRYETGPIAIISYRAEGSQMPNMMAMLKGFIHMLVTAGLLGFVMRLVGPASDYIGRIKQGTLIGAVGLIFANLSVPIWFLQPWGFHVNYFVYNVVAVILASAILGKFIKPEEAATAD